MTTRIRNHTIETLLARTIEVGECMEWQGYYGRNCPQVKHGGKLRTVRRVIRELQGREMKKGMFVSTSCGNPKRINPEHLIDRNARQHSQAMSSKVNYLSPTRVAKLQKSAEPRRKISDAGVQAALCDPRTCEIVAAEHGVHKSLISKIRRGEAHRQFNAATNPWAGLMR